jgi:hypothetical protein
MVTRRRRASCSRLRGITRCDSLPEWEHIHTEPRRDASAVVGEEYSGHRPDGYGYGYGYGYSRFCDLYVEWRHGITATMRHRG